MPKISVVMPCYNSEKFVAEAIASILGQSFSDFEFLIIDDGSTDRSSETILSFSDPRIIYLRNEKNIGVAGSLNRGLDIARGEYIARMDSDDISYPERFARQTAFLDENPDVVLCGAWIDFFPGTERSGEGRHKENVAYLDILKGWHINHPVVMMRKSVLDQNNLRYSDAHPSAEDYGLWVRLVHYGKIVNLQEVLLKYRWHENNVSVQKNSIMGMTEIIIKKGMLDFLTDDESLQNVILELLSGCIHEEKRLSVFGLPILSIESGMYV